MDVNASVPKKLLAPPLGQYPSRATLAKVSAWQTLPSMRNFGTGGPYFEKAPGRFYEELSHNTTAALKPKLELIYVRYQAAASTQTYEHQTESRRSANFTLTLSQKHAPGLGPPKFKHLSKACLTFTHDGKQEGDEGKSEGHNSPPPHADPAGGMKGITRKPRKLWQLFN